MSWSMVSEHEAEVSPDDVFRYYADPSTWGRWAHNTRWGKAGGPVRPGSRVDVRVASYPWTYSVLIREIVDGRRVVCEVRPFGVTIVSTYEVTPAGGGARLRHTIELDGPLQRAYRLVEGQYTRMLAVETRTLAELVAADRRPAPGRTTSLATG